MNTVTLQIPDYLFDKLRDFTRKEKITIDQFITSAIAEKMSAFATKDYLEMRAARANKKKFLDALSSIPDIEPEEYDKL
jgi:hypothetical protein